MSKISFLILVILATAVTSTPTKDSVEQGGCIKGLLRRSLSGQSATENATTNWEQAKREFHDNYNAKKLPKRMNAKLKDFQVGNKLGSGSYGVVSKVVKKSDGKEYAMKTMEKAVLDEDKDTENIYMVIDFVDGIELYEHVCRKLRLTEDEARYSAADVVLGIEYLHNVGCIHHDIKLDNIMIDTHCHCTVIDLGMAKLLFDAPTIQLNTSCGTTSYLAPEVLSYKPYGKRIDCWAFGVVLYTMVVGQFPFDNKDDQELKRLIKTGYITYPEKVVVSDEFKHLISKLLTRDPKDRYDINDIKADPWFGQRFKGNEGSAQTANVPIPAQ